MKHATEAMTRMSQPFWFTLFAVLAWVAMVDLAWIPLDANVVVTLISAPFILFFFVSLSSFVDAVMCALVFEEFEFYYFTFLVLLDGTLEMYRVSTTSSSATPVFNSVTFNLLLFLCTIGFSFYDCIMNVNLRRHSGVCCLPATSCMPHRLHCFTLISSAGVRYIRLLLPLTAAIYVSVRAVPAAT